MDTTGSGAWSIVRWVFPVAILVGGLAGAGALVKLREPPQRVEAGDRDPLVRTVTVEVAPPLVRVRTHGVVVPKTEITLAAEVSGKVVDVSDACRAGSFVERGATLLEIDRRRYELEEKRLVNEVKQVEIDLLQLDLEETNNDSLIAIAETEETIARKENDRFEALAKRSAASESQRDQATSQLMRIRSSMQTLRNSQRLIGARRDRLQAEVELTNARLEMARLDLEKTRIVAPIDGIVAEEFVEENVFVQPGTRLLTLEDTTAVEVKCSLRAEDLHWLTRSVAAPPNRPATRESIYQAPRVPATVTYRVAGREYHWEGYLARYEGIGLDERTRTIPCRIEVPQPTRSDDPEGPATLVRGMFCTVTLEAKTDEPLVRIPYAALRPGQNVWVVDEGVLRVRPVEVAKILDDQVLLHAGTIGLRPGDRVIVTPLALAIDGMRVRAESMP